MEPLLPPWRPDLAPATGDGDLTWAYPWPAGERLSRDLAAVADPRGLRVAELGCGRGRSGLTALLLGAARATFCDLAPEPLAYVREAVAANGLAERAATVIHAWGDPLPDGPFDLILGADILYRPAFHRALLASIAGGLAPGGRCLLADPRTALEEDLPRLAADLGLRWTQERRPGPYTLATLTAMEMRAAE